MRPEEHVIGFGRTDGRGPVAGLIEVALAREPEAVVPRPRLRAPMRCCCGNGNPGSPALAFRYSDKAWVIHRGGRATTLAPVLRLLARHLPPASNVAHRDGNHDKAASRDHPEYLKQGKSPHEPFPSLLLPLSGTTPLPWHVIQTCVSTRPLPWHFGSTFSPFPGLRCFWILTNGGIMGS